MAAVLSRPQCVKTFFTVFTTSVQTIIEGPDSFWHEDQLNNTIIREFSFIVVNLALILNTVY